MIINNIHFKKFLWFNKIGEKIVESTHDKDEISDSSTKEIAETHQIGELEVKGPSVFRTYLNQAELTRKAFTNDGWFKTGDTAQYLKELRAFKIVGRTSVDVIKSGGVKLSALEIEARLLEYKQVQDAAVFGVDDLKWGQLVVALLVVRDGFRFDLFLKWCRENMSRASVPKRVECVPFIERNQMGKIDKKSLIERYSKKQCTT